MNKFFIYLLIFRIELIHDVVRLLLIVSRGLINMTECLSTYNNSLFNDLAKKVGYEKKGIA